jgi:hypothetical protein
MGSAVESYDGRVRLTGWRGQRPVVGRATISDPSAAGWAGLFRHPWPFLSLGTSPVTVTLLDGDRAGQTAPAEWREDGLLVAFRGLLAFS